MLLILLVCAFLVPLLAWCAWLLFCVWLVRHTGKPGALRHAATAARAFPFGRDLLPSRGRRDDGPPTRAGTD